MSGRNMQGRQSRSELLVAGSIVRGRGQDARHRAVVRAGRCRWESERGLRDREGIEEWREWVDE
jgi:hypothetical protein